MRINVQLIRDLFVKTAGQMVITSDHHTSAYMNTPKCVNCRKKTRFEIKSV